MDNKKLINFISSLALAILFICSIGVASYIYNHEKDDFKQKQILLTGASSAFQTLNIKSENIILIEVKEYDKTEGFPYSSKVKIISSDSETPYYFECSDYKCETMIRHTYPVED